MRRLLGKISGLFSNRTKVGIDKAGNKYFTRNEEVDGVSKCFSTLCLSLYIPFYVLLSLLCVCLMGVFLLCFEILGLYLCSLSCMNSSCNIGKRGVFDCNDHLTVNTSLTSYTRYCDIFNVFCFLFIWLWTKKVSVTGWVGVVVTKLVRRIRMFIRIDSIKMSVVRILWRKILREGLNW